MSTTSVNEKLENLKNLSLSKVVEEQLEQMILSGELQPGERINESNLANTLQISRAPIREACRQLTQYGLIENRVGKGSFVRTVNWDEAIELYEIRGMLDALAAELASHHGTKSNCAKLKRLMDEMQEFADDDASADYFAANLEFHAGIVQLSGNSSLAQMYEVVSKKLSLFRRHTLSQPNRLTRSLSQHQGIFEAICAGDAELAGKRARAHVEDAKKVLLEQMP